MCHTHTKVVFYVEKNLLKLKSFYKVIGCEYNVYGYVYLPYLFQSWHFQKGYFQKKWFVRFSRWIRQFNFQLLHFGYDTFEKRWYS